LPTIGNKAIACHTCVLDIHGIKKSKTWSELKETFSPASDPNTSNSTTDKDVITLMEDCDWNVNDSIIVASTSHFHE